MQQMLTSQLVSTGKLFSQPGRVPDDEAVKALHIDVARKHQTIAKQALEDI
jgi:hypothetical protein